MDKGKVDMKIAPKVENYLLKIAKYRDDLLHKDNISLVNDTKKVGRVSVATRRRYELLKNQLPLGIYVKPETVVEYIEQTLQKIQNDALTYSPFVLNYPELRCCKPMKYRAGNIITGRDKEIDDILLSFTKSAKRSIVLVGEPGTGKTAIVRAVNNKLIERTVPRQLIGCYILNLDIPYVFAKFKEDPIGTIIKALETASQHDKVILFIDEVHQLLGHRMNDIMKPYLTEQMRFIGSTTIDEYHSIITDDKALERRFTLIPVDEPNLEKTCNMVKNTKSVYEEHHKCVITDNICDYLVVNGSRFLGHRKNPDKSLDLLDISCSIMYEKEIRTEDNQVEHDEFTLEGVETIKNNILNFKEISGNRVLNQDYINMAISSTTGIPFGEIKNSLNYSQVVKNISSKIFGQDDQIKSIANVINIFKHVKADRKRPVSVLLLVGPPGVGKASTCMALAKNLYGREEYFIDYDMTGLTSEFMITELKGAPPGYVGYQKSGKLVKQIRNNPQSVVYFRGINKCHSTIQQYIVDACRHGTLIDSAEREAPLNNAVIVYSITLTNEEHDQVFKNVNRTMGFGQVCDNTKNNKFNDSALKNIVGEELVKAADELIVFNSLDEKILEKIFNVNVNEHLEMYDVNVDRKKLKDAVLNDSKHGRDVMSKLSSEIPKFVFKKLKQEK